MEFLIFFLLHQNTVYANQLEINTNNFLNNNISNPKNKLKIQNFKLSDIPLTKVNEKEKNSFKERNPFLSPGNIESNDKSINIKGLNFKGIAKVGDKSVVFIETSQGINTYEIGQIIGGGYMVSRINEDDLEVEITNQSISQIIKLEKDD
tara:strand:- start:1308 stop:1757 length:450 start_codon:yes stop_codon:yes gene_type:complete